MKTKLLTLFLIALIEVCHSQSINMCFGVNTSSAVNGTIYDSGGPTGNYTNQEDCQFLITTGCSGNITLSFSSFQTEPGYDFLTIYNGSTTASPQLAKYAGVNLPPTVVATSGFMLLDWSSDGSSVGSGFAANWSLSNPNCPPVAKFSYNANSCVGKVNFVNESTFNPTSFLWNFGDGAGSTLPSPVHTYTSPGTYPVSLIISNMYGSDAISQNITVNPIIFDIGYNGLPLMNSALSFTTDNTTSDVYTWIFGDGALSGSANAIHTYTSMGTFTPTLVIASSTCVASATMQVILIDGVGLEDHDPIVYQASIRPNPSAGSSELNVQVAQESIMIIRVINQLGQIIQEISNQTLTAGEYQFKLEDLPAGFNYVHITENNRTKVMKLVTLR